MTELDDFRQSKDETFRHELSSPLTLAQRQVFQGLKYFPENPALDMEVPVAPFEEAQPVQMQTTTGDVQTYERFGRFDFEVDGVPASLTVYHNEHGYFLPFVDALRGQETYGAGRYLEPEPLGDNRFRINFNLAYNPYCAYNEAWSCPITPPENRVGVPIRAGEKVFHPPASDE